MKKSVRFFSFLMVLCLALSAGFSLQAVTVGPVLDPDGTSGPSVNVGPVLDPDGTSGPSYTMRRIAVSFASVAQTANVLSTSTVTVKVLDAAGNTVDRMVVDICAVSTVNKLLAKKGWQPEVYTIAVEPLR